MTPLLQMADRFNRIVDAVRKVGIGNVSLLSRMTGIPIETVRYKLAKQFSRLGLAVGVSIDYHRLGLSKMLVDLTIDPALDDQAEVILDRLARVAGLTYRAREVFQGRFMTIFAVPAGFKDEFRLFLKSLVDKNVLHNFEVKPLAWMRKLSFRPDLYDFRRGGWNIDWSRVDSTPIEVVQPALSLEPSEHVELDRLDVLLAKELQIDAFRPLNVIARKLRVHGKTLRYHYNRHVVPLTRNYYVRWTAAGASVQMADVIQVLIEFRNLTEKELALSRQVMNRFPFTDVEGSDERGFYFVTATVPAPMLVDSLNYVAKHFMPHKSKIEVRMFDFRSTMAYTIPYELFDEERGWTYPRGKMLQAVEEFIPRIRAKK